MKIPSFSGFLRSFGGGEEMVGFWSMEDELVVESGCGGGGGGGVMGFGRLSGLMGLCWGRFLFGGTEMEMEMEMV